MRIGLVLGGGGLTGGAFHSGVISGLADAGWDARTADVLLGTSVGSITATSLAAGFPPADFARRAQGQVLSPQANALLARVNPGSRDFDLPGRRSMRPAAPELLKAMVRDPRMARPGRVFAASLPEGKVSTAGIARSTNQLCNRLWPSERLRITAMRLSDGATVVFGATGAPEPDVGSAVAASCAIPGYFAPVTIGGERYVDGGTISACNAAELLHEGVDVVIISAPMAIHSGVRVSVGSAWRRILRAQVDREIKQLRAAGMTVVLFAPTQAVAEAMGSNPMASGLEPAVSAAAFEDTRARIAQSPTLRALLR